MSLFKKGVFLFCALLPGEILAEEVTPAPKVVISSPKKKISTIKNWHVGLGYLQWNEKINISRADQTSRGFSNYAGTVLSLERTWMRPSFQWGAGVFVGYGRATAGGFDGNLEFVDGNNRGWKTQGAKIFIDTMIHQKASVGLGGMGSFRQVNWEPADQTITVTSREPVSFVVNLDLRLQISEKITLIQTVAPLSLRGESQWMWIAQYSL